MIPWLVQAYDEDTDELVSVLKKLGVPHHVAKYNPLKLDTGGLVDNGKMAVIIGTIEFVRQPAKFHIGGCFYNWFDLDNFKCSKYYPTLGVQHLNRDCAFLPFAMVGENMPLLTHIGGNSMGEVFIRPDSGLKLFPAMCYPLQRTLFKQSWEGTKSIANANPESMCVIAPKQYVTDEWRFFVIDGKISTGSVYVSNGEVVFCAVTGSPRDRRALHYAETIATMLKNDQTEPADIYTLDVCSDTNGNLNVLELNAFNCSGLYAADKEKLVTDVNSYIERNYL